MDGQALLSFVGGNGGGIPFGGQRHIIDTRKDILNRDEDDFVAAFRRLCADCEGRVLMLTIRSASDRPEVDLGLSSSERRGVVARLRTALSTDEALAVGRILIGAYGNEPMRMIGTRDDLDRTLWLAEDVQNSARLVNPKATMMGPAFTAGSLIAPNPQGIELDRLQMRGNVFRRMVTHARDAMVDIADLHLNRASIAEAASALTTYRMMCYAMGWIPRHWASSELSLVDCPDLLAGNNERAAENQRDFLRWCFDPEGGNLRYVAWAQCQGFEAHRSTGRFQRGCCLTRPDCRPIEPFYSAVKSVSIELAAAQVS